MTIRVQSLPGGQNVKAFIVLIAIVGAIWYLSTLQFLSGDLYNNLWAPAHLLVHGQSPYHTTVLPQPDGVASLPAVWLPMAIGLFFPLGWLTICQTSQLWLVGAIASLVITVWLSSGARRPPPVSFALNTLAVLMFPPVLSHFRLGQFTVLATLTLLLAARFVKNSRYLLVGFLVAVSLAKPQLGVLAVPGLFLAYGRIHRFRGVMSLAGALVLWIVLLTAPLWIAYPLWFNDFVTVLRQNYDWAQPCLFALLRLQWGTFGLLLWGLLAAGVFSANVWLWLKHPPRDAVVWSLALTPLVTPYVWSWDFVMLVPLMVYAFFCFRSRISRALLGLGYILCWSLMVWIRYNTDNSDHRFWWMPWLIVASVCIAGAYRSREPRFFLRPRWDD